MESLADYQGRNKDMNSCFALTTGIKSLQPFETHPATVAGTPLKNTGMPSIGFIPHQVVQLWFFHSIVSLRFMSALHHFHEDETWGYQGAGDRSCMDFMTPTNTLDEEKLNNWYMQCSVVKVFTANGYLQVFSSVFRVVFVFLTSETFLHLFP